MKNPFENFGKFQQRANGPINPLVFTTPNQPAIIDPLITVDDHPNDEDHFAILKTTENGKYVMNGMLHFVFNGVDITTELNNVIFIDMLRKAIYIKDYYRVTEEIQPADPEERQYIILYSSYSNDEHLWEAMQGRINTYEWIRDNIEGKEINPEESYVLVETVPYKDALTVSQFIKYLQNADLVDQNDGFDIDDYIF